MTSNSFRLVADDKGVGWIHASTGRRLPLVAGADGENENSNEFEIPEDLTTLGDDELVSLTERAEAALDAMVEQANEDGHQPSQQEVQAVTDLAAAIRDLHADQTRRDDEAAERKRLFDEAVGSVRQADEDETVEDETESPATEDETVESETEVVVEGELVDASTRRPVVRVVAPPKLNPTLADIRARQAAPTIEDRRPQLKITAAADVPHFSNGEEVPTLEDLGRAASERAKALGIGNGSPHFVPLAKLERDFPMVLDADTMTPQQIRSAWEDHVHEMAGGDLTKASNIEALVAAGGWCAPSEIRYDFFQISEVAGLVDVPTFGVRRGGLKWPQSLSLFDFFALAGAPASGMPTNATMPWEWTETDDISAATGAPTKACLRPPCPGFDEARLRVFGLCVLAGNLTDDAFPELIRHFLAQTVVAHNRVINRRILLQMAAGSTATTPTSNTASAVNAWLGGLSLNAMDYREKHGMRDDAVLEVVAPSWAREVLRSDLAKKNGLDRLDAADAYLMDLFNVRNLRVQWVQDWQTRLAGTNAIAHVAGTIPATWPTTAQVLMYAPGTWGRGNGMTLDLGVVRDSVLNKTNDHTAAWTEEATMVAKFGHESRVITLDTIAAGATGAQPGFTGP